MNQNAFGYRIYIYVMYMRTHMLLRVVYAKHKLQPHSAYQWFWVEWVICIMVFPKLQLPDVAFMLKLCVWYAIHVTTWELSSFWLLWIQDTLFVVFYHNISIIYLHYSFVLTLIKLSIWKMIRNIWLNRWIESWLNLYRQI